MLMNCSNRIDGVTIVFSFSVCDLLRFRYVLSHISIGIVKRFHFHAKVFFIDCDTLKMLTIEERLCAI